MNKVLVFIAFTFLFSQSFLTSQEASSMTAKDSIKIPRQAAKLEKKRIQDSIKAEKKAIAEEKKRIQDSIIYAKSADGIWTDKKGTEWYQGQEVFTGPRGGKYIINSNGNKEYIHK